MKLFNHFNLAFIAILCCFVFSASNLNAENNSVQECQAEFWGYPEGTLAYFEPHNFYDEATYFWDFGDGNTSNEQYPLHEYEVNADNFTFEVTLTITQPDGETCTFTEEFSFISEECNSMFEYNVQPDGLTVEFEDVSWGIITSWLWDFGDGNTSTDQHPTHVYEEGGYYVVNLTVECLGDQAHDMPMEIEVAYYPIECIAEFDLDGFGTEFNFYPILYTEDATYAWNFGDGATSNELTPTHVYEAETGSTFLVELTITLEDGQVCTYAIDAVIELIDECNAMFEYWTISDDGLVMEFLDVSWGNVEEWEWHFGDGSTSSEQNPIHLYTAGGDYEVILTILCTNGHANSMIMPIHIGNGGQCDAIFWYEQELTQVSFYPTLDVDGIAYAWDFGDGNTSAEKFPVHSYELGPDPQEVMVTLTMTLADGIICTFTEWLFLEPLECTSMSSYYVVGSNVLEIQFIDESWGIPTSWEWDFGDGNFSTAQNPIHTYAEPGNYIATLTINCVGFEASAMPLDVHVGDVLFCDAGFWYDIDFNAATFHFHPFTQIDDAIYQWDFGDGNTSNEQIGVNDYTQDQDLVDYLVTLNIILPDGQTCFYEEYIFVEPVECNAMFEYGPAPNDGSVIAFWDTSWGTAVSWFWDFGDGSTSTEQNPTHNFDTGDIHNVTLTITCIGGEENSITMEVYTVDFPQCEAVFNSYILDDYGVYFESELMYEEATYFWGFGDGHSSDEMTPTHYYEFEGWYPIIVEIIFLDGSFCYYEDEILIGENNPELPIECEAFFSFEQGGDNPMNISFFNESFSDHDEINVQWHFGDGVTSTETNPQHQYQAPGVYIVTLTIVSGDCIDTFPMQIFIGDETFYPNGCQALFLPVDTYSGFIFYDLSHGIVSSYLWDFGDGNLSTNATPFHDYAIPGEYEVTLTIITEDGCESMFSITITESGFMGNSIQAYMILSTSDLKPVNEVNLFPNPVNTTLTLAFESTTSNDLNFEIITVDGKILLSETNYYLEGTNSHQFDVSSLVEGIYVLKISDDHGAITKRFLKF